LENNKTILRRNMLRHWQSSLTFIGPAVALVSYLIEPTTWIGVMVIAQLVLYFSFRRLAKIQGLKSWGVVKDKIKQRALGTSIVRVFDTKFNKLLETQVSDWKGRYAFLVGGGEYYMTSEKRGYHPQKTGSYDFSGAESGVLAKDIEMEQLEKDNFKKQELVLPEESEELDLLEESDLGDKADREVESEE